MVFQWVDCITFSIPFVAFISYGSVSSSVILDLFFYLWYNKAYLKIKINRRTQLWLQRIN